jgi:pyridoxine 5-phosphate synthase
MIKSREIHLGVNIDHVATLREARGTRYPDPVHAAFIAQDAGADSITIHLREDRRHIQDHDVERLKTVLMVPMNLEMAATAEMLKIATQIKPEECCLVPERRKELTTEGGLDVAGNLEYLSEYCGSLKAADIQVSLFIDPEPVQIEAAVKVGAAAIELHTGRYADARSALKRSNELVRLQQTAASGHVLGLQVNAGHGLHYHNVQPVAAIPELATLNIGHAIVGRAVMAGLADAVCEMKRLMREARQ